MAMDYIFLSFIRYPHEVIHFLCYEVTSAFSLGQIRLNHHRRLTRLEMLLQRGLLVDTANSEYFVYFVHHVILCCVPAVAFWWPYLTMQARWLLFGVSLLIPTLGSAANMAHNAAHAYAITSKRVYRSQIPHFLEEHVLDPIMLRTTGGFWLNQHVHQHHKFNNSPGDPQTLMYFRRDSVVNAVWFVLTETMNTFLKMPWFHLCRNSGRFYKALASQMIWYALHILLWLNTSSFFTCVVLGQRYGSWLFRVTFLVEYTQHGLINAESPLDVMHNTVTTLRPGMDQMVMVDTGFHHEHSRNSTTSAAVERKNFLANQALYTDNAMVFDADLATVSLSMITKQTKTLASLWIPLSKQGKKMRMHEREELMRAYLKPVCSYRDIPWARLPAWPTNMM